MRGMFRNKEVRLGVLVKTLETIEQPRESSHQQNNENGSKRGAFSIRRDAGVLEIRIEEIPGNRMRDVRQRAQG